MSAESAVLTMEGSRPEPGRRRQLVSSGVMGMIMFTFTEVMLFSGMISAHAIVRARSIGQYLGNGVGHAVDPVFAKALRPAGADAAQLGHNILHPFLRA